MPCRTSGQPPSIGDDRQIVVPSGGSQVYRDGQPPSVNDYPNSGEVDSSELDDGDEPYETLNRPRLVWTPQLHKRFVDAVAHLGINNAVPKTVMQHMSVDGLTRENVASHLQKYRLYLKRMQGLSSGGNGSGGFGSGGDPATDHLFASSPVPPHFLNQSNSHPNSDSFLPYLPVAELQQQLMAAVAGHNQMQTHVGDLGASTNHHQFFSRQASQPVHKVGNPVHDSYMDDDDLECAKENKTLNLFPMGDD